LAAHRGGVSDAGSLPVAPPDLGVLSRRYLHALRGRDPGWCEALRECGVPSEALERQRDQRCLPDGRRLCPAWFQRMAGQRNLALLVSRSSSGVLPGHASPLGPGAKVLCHWPLLSLKKFFSFYSPVV